MLSVLFSPNSVLTPIYHKVYEIRQQAIADVTRYIEIFYNRQRIQKGLGFKSPAQVFQDFYRQAA